MGKFKGFIKSKGFKILLIVIVLLAGYKFYLNYKKVKQAKVEIEILHNKIELAREKNKELKEELDNVNDPEYIEKIARKELGLVKPGELLFIPVEDKDKNKEGKK